MKQQRRLLFAPYLVPLTPSLWTFLLKVVERRSGTTTTTRTWKKFPKKKSLGGKNLGGRRQQETLLYGVRCFFFPGGLWDSCEGSAPPMTVCLPVRMGTVSACDWMPVLALPSGWSLHCGTASE